MNITLDRRMMPVRNASSDFIRDISVIYYAFSLRFHKESVI